MNRTGATFTFVELSAIGRDSRIELIEPSFEAGVALFETEALAEPQRDRVVVLPEEQRNKAVMRSAAPILSGTSRDVVISGTHSWHPFIIIDRERVQRVSSDG